MHRSNHGKGGREYVVSDKGVTIISTRCTDYAGLISGLPQREGVRQAVAPEPKAV